jgi:hypothetical protein
MVWLCLVPIGTTWLWRLCFATSPRGGWAILATSVGGTPHAFVQECASGTLLSACIVFLLLALASLRDTLRALQAEGHRLVALQGGAGMQLWPLLAQGAVGVQPGVEAAGDPVGDVLAVLAAPLDEDGDQLVGGNAGVALPPAVGLQELIGVEGPVVALFENAITVLASNAVFLCAAIFMPFTVGRLALGAVLSVVGTPTVLYQWLLLHAAPTNSSTAAAAANSTATTAAADLQAVATPPSLNDMATLMLGYALLAAAAALWLCVVCAWHVRRAAPHGVHVLVARQAAAAVLMALVSAKVVLLLVVELGAFPLACGAWLAVCGLPLLGATTLRQHVDNVVAAPCAYAILHWAAGIAFMLSVSHCVACLRQVLRPGILAFLRDPADPQFDPFRDLVREPLRRHALRVAASCCLYGVLIVGCVWTPVALLATVTPPGTLPLRIAVPFMNSWADVLVLRMLPTFVNQLNGNAMVRSALKAWITAVATPIGMKQYLLPGDNEPPMPPLAGPQAGVAAAVAHARMFAPRTWFAPRVLALLLAAWLTCVVVNLAAGFGPLVLGRYLFAAAGQAADHDLCCFALGLIALRLSVAAAGIIQMAVRAACAPLGPHGFAWQTARGVTGRSVRACHVAASLFTSLALAAFILPLVAGLLSDLCMSAPLREGRKWIMSKLEMNATEAQEMNSIGGHWPQPVNAMVMEHGAALVLASACVGNRSWAAMGMNTTAMSTYGLPDSSGLGLDTLSLCARWLWWLGFVWLRIIIHTYAYGDARRFPPLGEDGDDDDEEEEEEIDEFPLPAQLAADATLAAPPPLPRWRLLLMDLVGVDGHRVLIRKDTLLHLLLPATGVLLCAVFAPWVAGYVWCTARAVLHAGNHTEECLAVALGWSHPLFAVACILHIVYTWMRGHLHALHDAVRDERYLVGLALNDYREGAKTKQD